MLRPTKPPKKFEKYGFKKCKGDYGQNGCRNAEKDGVLILKKRAL